MALLLRIELHVPGEPHGVSDSTLLSRRRVLTVWAEEYLGLTAAAEAHSTILESLDSALENLVTARRVVEGQGSDG